MKNRIFIAIIATNLFLAGCSGFPQFPSKEAPKQEENTTKPTLSLATRINQLVAQGAALEEINNPGLTIPADIDGGQMNKYFKINDILFALVVRNSMNVVLTLPTDFTPIFAGVLVAEEGQTKWSKILEIKDSVTTDKNNPYYLVTDGNNLLLTVVDQNGGGSGEGIMKVFALDEAGNWDLKSCYYFGGHYSDPSTDGDYFASSADFSKQTPQSIEPCNNAQLIPLF